MNISLDQGIDLKINIKKSCCYRVTNKVKEGSDASPPQSSKKEKEEEKKWHQKMFPTRAFGAKKV